MDFFQFVDTGLYLFLGGLFVTLFRHYSSKKDDYLEKYSSKNKQLQKHTIFKEFGPAIDKFMGIINEEIKSESLGIPYPPSNIFYSQKMENAVVLCLKTTSKESGNLERPK
jgi:hypothetical protein